MNLELDRRDFLKQGAALSALAAAGKLGAAPGFRAPKLDKVRVGFVGAGLQGTGHIRNLLQIAQVELVAICDIVPEHAEKAQKLAVEAGQSAPDLYTRGDTDYRRLCARDDIDLVYNATPWRWHTPVMVEAMENGKHAATEIPAAVTIEQAWQLVETAERTGKHCIQMENCNYDKMELMVLNMVRKGLLGDLIHARCGYLHDLRAIKFSDNHEGLWRREHSIHRNGDLYPSHGLAPIAQCMNINRGNQFDHLVSMASPSNSLNLYAAENFGEDSPPATQNYELGDVVTSMIRTHHGQTIVVTHDTNTPRPYSRDILVQGTRGIVQKYPSPKIHIEGVTEGHGWEELDRYVEEYQHPLWTNIIEKAKGAGHGGMDFIEDYRLIQCLIEGQPMDTDVYDAAALSAVSELSERSIANRSKSMDFPDFTRGAWKTRAPLGIVTGA
ncbi:MAG: Gfo/Idh/MocA family protein [Verrucomicrobiia bacterium]